MSRLAATTRAVDIEARYQFVDECPDGLFDACVELAVGDLPSRVRGVRMWHDALCAGRVPAEGSFPPNEFTEPYRRWLETSELVRFLRGHPDLAVELLRDILASMSRAHARLEGEVDERMRAHEARRRRAIERARANADASRKRFRSRAALPDEPAPPAISVTPADLERLREEFRTEANGIHSKRAVGDLKHWDERIAAWHAFAGVFDDLGLLFGRGWDLTSGILRHVGWHDVVRLHEWIRRLPELADIIRSLGRLHESESGDSVAETIMSSVRRLEEERREVNSPHAVGETRGLERGADLARMLPAEASLLGHPTLRWLFHARRAERGLIQYCIEGTEIEQRLVERENEVAETRSRPRPQRGPILVVLDTSGSMHGQPEQVAKAVVLEAARTAHAESRGCHLYSYSGRGDIQEHTLALDAEGMKHLLAFLSMSFRGGNDELGVMTRVVERVDRDPAYEKADVLFVSDGQWPVPDALRVMADRVRAAGTRIHGIQIGDNVRSGLDAICAPVHRFDDWGRMLEGRSLT